MKRNHSPLLSLAGSLLTIACHTGNEDGGAPIDLGTASTSPTSATTDPPTTSLPTTTATSSTSTDTTATGPGPETSTGTLDTSGADPGTASSGTTELPPPDGCGDANLDPGEECDLGAAQNDDHGACTLTCKLAKCGDQLIWASNEDCDNGPNNNDVLYGGCTTQCKYGPRCGDTKLQGPEECDLGPDNGTGEFQPDSVPCDNGCRYDAKLVFLSSVTYKAGSLGGAKGAHSKCMELALMAKFDNAAKFMAWISDAQHSPSKDFTKTPGMAYVRPDGVRIADDWDDLILTGPDDGIIVTETGETRLSAGVWTGTGPNGELDPGTLTCKSWSSSEAGDTGIRGLSGVDKKQGAAWTEWVDKRQWTHYAIQSCIQAYRIYCVEQ